jgi:hypothetical protein
MRTPVGFRAQQQVSKSAAVRPVPIAARPHVAPCSPNAPMRSAPWRVQVAASQSGHHDEQPQESRVPVALHSRDACGEEGLEVGAKEDVSGSGMQCMSLLCTAGGVIVLLMAEMAGAEFCSRIP